MNLDNHNVKAIIRDIHRRAIEDGEKQKTITKYLAHPINTFYNRHPEISKRLAERVDHGRINMATKETITQYFHLLKATLVKHNIMELDEDGTPVQDSIKGHCIYLADETGWGVESTSRTVIGRKGAKHIYNRKSSDESHKTLMLGVCGNADVLKPLIILEKSFPLVSEGEADHLPENILLSKTEKGSMEQNLFCEWIEKAVIPHKQTVNPDGMSLLIVDNHVSRFSTKAIDLCINNNIEMMSYPGHLTHILQGPDVVLNKPISTIVDRMVHNNPLISGNSDLTRVAFIAIIEYSVNSTCTRENVLEAFRATGIIPFNPGKIQLDNFPSSTAELPDDSPIIATCSECRINNVELHPLVKQGVIPKKLAEVFTYTPPPKKTRTQSKVVKTARIITSEEVSAEVEEVERKKKEKGERVFKKKLAKAKEVENMNAIISGNESKQGGSGKDHISNDLEDVEGEKTNNSEQIESETNSRFAAGDYVKVVKSPFKDYYATVIGLGYGDEIEINYFEKGEKCWRLKDNDFDSRDADDLMLVPANNVTFSWRGHVYFN